MHSRAALDRYRHLVHDPTDRVTLSYKMKRAYRRLFPSRLAERTLRFEPPIETRRERIDAWVDSLVVDHAFIRFVYTNFHKVDDQFYRSSQPLPHQVRRWGRMGIKTIINLRGGRQFGSYPLEVEAAERSNITMVDLQLRSRALPDVEQLEKLEALLETITYPAVVHCKAGADRASLASALYMLIRHNDPERAMGQISWRYGHMKGSKTGVLDAMLETYLRDGAPAGQSFMEWARDGYDPEAIAANFKPSLLASFVTDSVLHRE